MRGIDDHERKNSENGTSGNRRGSRRTGRSICAQPRRVLCADGCNGLFGGFLTEDVRSFSRTHSRTSFASLIPSASASRRRACASLAVSITSTLPSFRREKNRCADFLQFSLKIREGLL